MIGGDWSQNCSMFSIKDKDLKEKDLPLLLCRLFGPSGYVLDSNVYVAGLDHDDPRITRVMKLEKQDWIEFKNIDDHPSGGFSHLLYIQDKFLIFGGLTKDYEPSSDIYSFNKSTYKQLDNQMSDASDKEYPDYFLTGQSI